MRSCQSQFGRLFKGERGLPVDYPTPHSKNLLFFIQRNTDKNAVIYEINHNEEGLIQGEKPIKVFWQHYTNTKGKTSELSFVQRKLAYGYKFNTLKNNLVEFSLVSYDNIKLRLKKMKSGHYKAQTKINNLNAYLNHIYVFADELGAFPRVRFIELYGEDVEHGLPIYEKLVFSH